VALAEDDTFERNAELDVDLHAILGAFHLHFGDLRHVHHCSTLRPHALIKALSLLTFNQHFIVFILLLLLLLLLAMLSPLLLRGWLHN